MWLIGFSLLLATLLARAVSDGTVVAWGDDTYGQTTVPAGLTGVTAVAASNNHTVALKSDGTVVAWGYNGYGQATVPAGLTGVTAIAAGIVPTDPGSHFDLRVEPVAGQPTQKRLVFSPRWTVRTYHVVASTTLQTAGWSALTDGIVSDNGNERSVTDTAAIQRLTGRDRLSERSASMLGGWQAHGQPLRLAMCFLIHTPCAGRLRRAVPAAATHNKTRDGI